MNFGWKFFRVLDPPRKRALPGSRPLDNNGYYINASDTYVHACMRTYTYISLWAHATHLILLRSCLKYIYFVQLPTLFYCNITMMNLSFLSSLFNSFVYPFLFILRHYIPRLISSRVIHYEFFFFLFLYSLMMARVHEWNGRCRGVSGAENGEKNIVEREKEKTI